MLNINYLAVLVSAIVAMGVGFLWYGPFFGKEWMRVSKVGKKDIEAAKKNGMTGTYLVSFLSVLVMSFFTAVLVDVMSARTIVSGALAGAMIWLGFVATTHLPHYLFEGRSIGLYYIAVSHHLAELVIIGALLAVW